jgi:hypothetical protein
MPNYKEIATVFLALFLFSVWFPMEILLLDLPPLSRWLVFIRFCLIGAGDRHS